MTNKLVKAGDARVEEERKKLAKAADAHIDPAVPAERQHGPATVANLPDVSNTEMAAFDPAEIQGTPAERIRQFDQLLEKEGARAVRFKVRYDMVLGLILAEVNRTEIYAEQYQTFEEYADSRGISRPRAYALMEAAPVLRILMSSIEDIPTLRPAVSQAIRLVDAYKQEQETGVRLVLDRAAEMVRESAKSDARDKARKAAEKAKADAHAAAVKEAQENGGGVTAVLEPVTEADIAAELSRRGQAAGGTITAVAIEAASIELGYTKAPEKVAPGKALANAATFLGAAYKAVAPRTVESLAKEDPERAHQLLDAAEAELRKIERRIHDGRKAISKTASGVPTPRTEKSADHVTDAEIVDDNADALADT
ncbi:hypothetical protein OHA91_39730 (plasmid) [Streptomyces erythrochromogenes]|uniref:Uncharacterized protein n=1 Tax=Streptomyces erythrochromogenes TaxID=285574 RepID=A0ABZ1QRC7_9ACTN|nr:hypothetical protein [Streptomyces erythrochromogenes]